MAVKRGNEYLCGYCGKAYTDPFKADNCRDEHDLVYIPISKTDLNRLLQFVYLTNADPRTEKLLTRTLMRTLSRYLKGNA